MIVEWNENNIEKIAEYINSDGVAVIPTDTLYGILTRAVIKNSVEKIYHIKGRTPSKPFIILISKIEDIDRFGVVLSNNQSDVLGKYWPGKVSIILPCLDEKYFYLHRGTNSLAFRLPNDELLRSLIDKTGPLVAPSANPEGLPPAKNVAEASVYFGDKVGLYADDGTRTSEPSALISTIGDEIRVLRGSLEIS